MKHLIWSTLLVCGMHTAYAAEHPLTLGAGKALNNTNSDVPGWVSSARLTLGGGRWLYDAAYTRIGISYLAKDAAISTLGVSRSYGKFRYGAAVITGASYSHAVWWAKARPHESCVMGQDDCDEYKSDGHHFSRACHWCGGVLSATYSITDRLSIRTEYYGLRHMNPTYQGVVVQFTYGLL